MIKEIQDTLALQNLQERVSKLEQLSDVFEYGHGLSEEDVIERYLRILDEYMHNADPEIREWALSAIREMRYRLAHASDNQRTFPATTSQNRGVPGMYLMRGS